MHTGTVTCSGPTRRALDLALLSRRAATTILRYGLVVLIGWFGLFKFTPAEAQAIQPLVANSPLLSWLYAVLDVPGASRLPLAPRASAAGSIAAVGMFATTLSFLATTPGVWVRIDGFIVPNETGTFLIKDVLLLGAALWTASEALAARWDPAG